MSRLIDVDTLIAELMKHIWDDKKFSEIVKDVPTIHAIPIDAVKKAREEISDYNIKEHYFGSDSYLIGIANGMDKAVEILDKLIAESEENNGNVD